MPSILLPSIIKKVVYIAPIFQYVDDNEAVKADRSPSDGAAKGCNMAAMRPPNCRHVLRLP